MAKFDKDKVTCLAPDWSKEGMGFLLQQKHCQCIVEKTPICCPKSWCLIFVGSRFSKDAEHRYSPIEGGAAVITWALEKHCMFILGCQNIIVVTDHEPMRQARCEQDRKIPGCFDWNKRLWDIDLPSNTALGSGTEALMQFPATQWPRCRPSLMCFQPRHLSQIFWSLTI